LALNGQINDVGEYQRINIDKSYRLGVELVGGIELTEGLNLNANATFSTNKVEQFTEFVDTYDADFNWIGQTEVVHEDTDLAFSPSVIAGAELSYDLLRELDDQSLNIALLSKYVGKQYIDNTSDENNVIDAYFFSDFKIGYTISKGMFSEIGLNVMVRNVFDSLFETNAWSYRYLFDGSTAVQKGLYPQAGRNFLIGLNVSF
jgi:iron complex outermembrane receptor protein